MYSKRPTKKRIIILVATALIVGGFLIYSWIVLPENLFPFVLIGFLIFLMILEYLYGLYRDRKK